MTISSVKQEKPKHGGYRPNSGGRRPGAGRPKLKHAHVQIAAQVLPSTAEELKTRAAAEGVPIGNLIDRAFKSKGR